MEATLGLDEVKLHDPLEFEVGGTTVKVFWVIGTDCGAKTPIVGVP